MEGVDEVWVFILRSQNILLVSASELNLEHRISNSSKPLGCRHLIIVVQDIDLVWVAGVWIREEEVVRRQTDRIQSKVRPLLTDPVDELSGCEKYSLPRRPGPDVETWCSAHLSLSLAARWGSLVSSLRKLLGNVIRFYPFYILFFLNHDLLL